MLGNSFAMPYDLRVLVGSHINQVGLAWTHLMDAATQAMSLWLGALPEHEATGDKTGKREIGCEAETRPTCPIAATPYTC